MRTICIYHSRDLDGWCSAAIVKKWWKSQFMDGFDRTVSSQKEIDNVLPHNILTFLGWDYGNDIPDLSSYDKVIMVDISFPKDEMKKLWSRLNKNFIWIDHHISAIKENEPEKNSVINGLLDTKFAACELSWEYFFPNQKMPEFVRLLGRYDCFGHVGTDEEQKVLHFQYAARAMYYDVDSCLEGLNNDIKQSYFTDRILNSGENIYKYLCVEAKQTYKRRFTIDFDGYKFATVNAPRFNPINFGIEYHNDKADDVYYYDGACCFHYENGKWCFSLYNDNGKVDVSVIAKKRGGGGHKGAAGFILSDDEFDISKKEW